MVSYKEAGRMLDELMEALPPGIFDGLNGGVNLLEEEKTDSRGGYILGLYHSNIMGRYIEIFYGSFAGLYGDIPAEQFRLRLRSTLHHELTHHVEGLAGDRSLERWDEEQELLWQELEDPDAAGMEVGSLLFLDDDDCSLAPAAKALFRKYAAERCPDIPCESAGIFAAGGGLQPDCLGALRALGGELAGHEPRLLDRELFEKFDLAVCMTLAQADELLDRYPGSERKLVCADGTDILHPRMKMNWKKCLLRLDAMAEEQSRQLSLPEEGEEGCRVLRLCSGDPPEYVETVARLERENFSAPWTEAMLRRALERPDEIFLAALRGGRLLGYIGAKLIVDELEIYNVAVDAPFRGQHLGSLLLDCLCDEGRKLAAERISLEVRCSNGAAIALYESRGFQRLGLRKNYYEKPREDALIMALEL